MLFNEPKLLKYQIAARRVRRVRSFSALQRAEIAEIQHGAMHCNARHSSFSALQRAEIAEIIDLGSPVERIYRVSVLFNEPKLLKSSTARGGAAGAGEFQCSSTSRNC